MLLPQKDLSPEDLASRAEIVFKGVCEEKTKESTAHPATKVPVPLNVYSFRIEEVMKGNLKAGDVFKVKQIGVETRREAYRLGVESVSGHHFETGKSYLLFLGGENRWGIRPLIGGGQGRFQVMQEEVLKSPVGKEVEYREFVGKVRESLKK